MKILDVLTAPWAIQPSKLIEIQGIYATHLRGEKIDIKGVEAALGKPLNNQASGYSVTDGVAVLPISGVISKRMNLMSQISGGTSSELVGRDFSAALNDPAVNAIILQIDSPGGTVDGTETLANLIRAGKDIKPVVALADGTMASAAYWIGSAADAIYISDNVTQVGSIGVVATHTDISAAEAKDGVKTTEITAGKFKRAASQYGALTESGKQTIQDQVDYIYSIFVQTVANNRGVSVDAVLQDMADGRIFIGQQAIDAGLVDGVSTLDALIAKLSQQGADGKTINNNLEVGRVTPAMAGVTRPTSPSILTGEENMEITLEKVLADAPEIASTLRAEGITKGATAERERIQAVLGQSMAGHEALVQSLAFDGKTTGPEAAVAVLSAEKTLRKTSLDTRRTDAPAPVAHAAAPTDKVVSDEDLSDLPIDEQAKAQWEGDKSLRAEFGNFAQYLAYAKAHANGQVKVLKK